MKRIVEPIIFAAIAGVIHITLFSSAPESGAASSGSGGEAMVSIQAAPETIAKMVDAWERPPETQATLETEMAEPLQQPQSPALPQFELARTPRAAALIALSEPQRAEAPQADTAPPPPPPPPKPKPEPKPEPKPQPRPKPAPKPQPKGQPAAQTSAGRAEQKSAGSGGGAHAGQAGGAQAATADAGRQTKLQHVWGAKIRARVARRTPRGKGAGTVLVDLTVARNGQLLNSRIVRSSGNATLDQAALAAVRSAGRFPAAPKKLRLTQMSFTLPIQFVR